MTISPVRRRALVGLWALGLIAALSGPASAQSPSLKVEGPPLAAQHLEALAQSMVADTSWGVLADARRLTESLGDLDPTEARRLCLDLAARLMKGRAAEPRKLAAAHLIHRASRYDHYLGEPDKVDGRLAELGFLTAWQIAGPFENGNMAGFDVIYGPEASFDPASRFEGKVGAVTWQPLSLSVRGYNRLGSAINPSRSAAIYAATTVESPRATRAVLRLSVDGAYKVWVNGTLVARVETDLGGDLDRDAQGIALVRGKNTILVKVAAENRGQVGFFARLTAVDGQPMALKSTPSVEKGALLASPEPSKGAFDVLHPSAAAAKAAEKPGADRAERLVDAAKIATSLRALDPATPWRDLAEEAITATKDGRILDQAAEVLPDHWRRLQLRRTATKNAPNDPWLMLSLAAELRQSMGMGNIPEVLELTDNATKAVDGLGRGKALLPRMMRARVLYGRGMGAAALSLLTPFQKTYPRSYPLLGLLRAIRSNLGHTLAAQTLADDQLALRQLVPGTVTDRARNRLSAAKPEEALALLDNLIKHRPDALGAMALRAQVLHQLGRSKDALAAFDTALTRSPGRISLLRGKAEIYELMGDDDGAVAVYEEALEIAPEDRALAESIRALRPDTNSFESAWRWRNDKLTPRDDAAERHAGQDFYYIGRQDVVLVSPSGRSTRFNQQIVHVLNEEGARAWNSNRMYFSPGFERVELVSVRVRKVDGTISEVHRTGTFDAGRGSGNLYYLRRYLYVEVPTLEPGDVVEYAWRDIEVGNENFREGYFGDMWYFEDSVDIEDARYVVLAPEATKLHTRNPQRVSNITTEVQDVEYEQRKLKAHIWSATDVTRVKGDQRMPGRSEVFDYVLVSTYETWDQVGKWWWNLIKDQLVVDAEIKAIVADVTKGITDDRQKVAAIYNWVIKNTRYVGIEFGVHGWKPYRTTLCVRRKFGDCKDKASLIKVMLDTAGVETHLVLIRTRRLGQISSDPPSLSIFNHAIAYVPKFDLFLDGTAEFSGSSELPHSDQGGFSVIVADGGAVTVRNAPLDLPDVNRFVRILDVDLTVDPLRVKGQINAVGADAVYYRRKFESEEKRTETLAQLLARIYPGTTLISADFKEVTDREKPVVIDFEFEGGGFIKQVGDTEVLFPAGRELRMLDSYAPEASRDQDLMLSVPHTYTNRITYTLDAKTRVATPIKNLSGSSRFGTYEVAMAKDGDVVHFNVSYTSKVDRVNAEDYAAYRAWLNEMDRAINQRMIIEETEDQ